MVKTFYVDTEQPDGGAGRDVAVEQLAERQDFHGLLLRFAIIFYLPGGPGGVEGIYGGILEQKNLRLSRLVADRAVHIDVLRPILLEQLDRLPVCVDI